MAATLLAGYVEQFLSLHHVAVPAQPDSTLEAALSKRLPESRLVSIARQREPADRLVRALSSALVLAAARAEGLHLDPLAIAYPSDGPPHWPGGGCCSVSHSAVDVVVLIGSSAPLGVDVENPFAVKRSDLRLVLPAGLRHGVASGSVDPTSAWMRIEAALKAAGTGLRGLNELVFDTEVNARIGSLRLDLRRVALSDQHSCWCAVGEGQAIRPIPVKQHSVLDLIRLMAAL